MSVDLRVVCGLADRVVTPREERARRDDEHECEDDPARIRMLLKIGAGTIGARGLYLVGFRWRYLFRAAWTRLLDLFHVRPPGLQCIFPAVRHYFPPRYAL